MKYEVRKRKQEGNRMKSKVQENRQQLYMTTCVLGLVILIAILGISLVNFKLTYDAGFDNGYDYALEMTGTEPCWFYENINLSNGGIYTQLIVKNIPKGNGELGQVVGYSEEYINKHKVKECQVENEGVKHGK